MQTLPSAGLEPSSRPGRYRGRCSTCDGVFVIGAGALAAFGSLLALMITATASGASEVEQDTRTLGIQERMAEPEVAPVPADSEDPDQTIRDEVLDLLLGHPELRLVSVTVREAAVTLTGVVEEAADRARAESLTRSILRIESVDNQIRVGEDRSE